MRMEERFAAVARFAARRPVMVLMVVGLLALVGAGLALRLDPSADTDTLIDRGSSSYAATERFKQQFGDDAVVILIEGDLQRLVLTSDLARLISIEGCIAGNVPKGVRPPPGPCSELAKLKPAKIVYGPGTFINTAANQIVEGFTAQSQAKDRRKKQAGQAARKLAAREGRSKAEQERLGRTAEELVETQFTRDTLRLALRYGLTSVPSLDNPDFVSQLVFDTSTGTVRPKSRFAYLFPSPRSAVIQARLRPGLSEAQQHRTIELIRAAVGEDRHQLRRGGRYVVTGVPVVVDGLASAVKRSIFVLLLAALVVMAATLALVFRARLRLLPLALALAAAALTFGAVSLAGATLTMASIAALPVLIGLAVDYAIQFQARFAEVRSIGQSPPPAAAAAPAAAAMGAPTIATAGLSTAVGFLVLLLSPVPMVRGFGVLLVLGIVVAFACALTAGFAALARFSDPRPGVEGVPPFLPVRLARSLGERVRASRPGEAMGERLAQAWEWLKVRSARSVALAIRRPRKVLAIGLALAVAGWAADTQTRVISDVRELVPQDLQALKDINTLQRVTGVAGEVDVIVRVRDGDLTDPRVISWMTAYQREVLAANGYRAGATCDQARNAPVLCPALSLPDLFRSVDQTDSAAVKGLLDAVPKYFSQAVVSPDRRTANLAFGIRFLSLERQKEVIDDMKERLHPPEGVEAEVAGLSVLAADANAQLSSTGRRLLTLLAGLTVVFLVLLAVRRRFSLAAVPLIPIALATGWSAFVLFLLRIPLNPMSATLGALVIAISTEFSVLLSARYRQEREAGAEPGEAIALTYRSTGAAVLASGATAIAGFAALIASDIRMLRDFGVVTVVDLTVSLLGVMVVLPAALVWAEEHGPFRLSDLDPRRAVHALREHGRPRLRRPALDGAMPALRRLPRPSLPRRRRSREGAAPR